MDQNVTNADAAFDGQVPGVHGHGEPGRGCAPIPESCMPAVTDLIETALNNFQLTFRSPAHIDPPFTATPVDVFSESPTVVGPVGPFTTVVSFSNTTPGRMGAIVAAGQKMTALAFIDPWQNTAWRITKNGYPVPGFDGTTRPQRWNFSRPTRLAAPVIMNPGDIVALQVSAIGVVLYSAWGRLVGWTYPTRFERGDTVTSSLVD